MSIVPGQDIGSICWAPSESSDWLTACGSCQSNYEVSAVFDWSEREREEPLPADADIAAGRVQSFGSIDDLIADLQRPD